VSHLEQLKAWPSLDSPAAFGLHENAEIMVALNDGKGMIDSSLTLLSGLLTNTAATKQASAGAGPENLDSIIDRILTRLPPDFDIEYVQVAYAVSYTQSLNSVLIQECIRYNGVTSKVRSSLNDLKRAVTGLVVMSQELEHIAASMTQNKVPVAWKEVSYPSVKPLASWVDDLLLRLKFLSDWIHSGPPDSFWISGFFFTQSFLTGVRQNFARNHTIAIDELSLTFRVLTPQDCVKLESREMGAPADGAYVHGLFLQGGRWDSQTGAIAESAPRELFSSLPTLHLLPAQTSKSAQSASTYECPVYKTSERAGTLSTTGHSTNLVMHVLLPVHSSHTSQHWIKRGVALLCQLDD
jgi:dynein heavy chain